MCLFCVSGGRADIVFPGGAFQLRKKYDTKDPTGKKKKQQSGAAQTAAAAAGSTGGGDTHTHTHAHTHTRTRTHTHTPESAMRSLSAFSHLEWAPSPRPSARPVCMFRRGGVRERQQDAADLLHPGRWQVHGQLFVRPCGGHTEEMMQSTREMMRH